ncbi:MAG: hypothetical protein IT450_24215 [Phycisphaerales bacterium]|nr:hypothetical protein [Phycisphaerales bacterium]
MRTLNDNLAIRMIHTPGGDYAAAAVDGTWVSMAGYRRILFVSLAGGLDGNIAVAAYEATDAAGSDAQALSGLSDSFVNGTDEDRVGLIEVRDVDLSDGFGYVTIRVTPAATDPYSCIAILGEPITAPVSNATTDDVAFNTGE